MKVKTKISALTLALALCGGALVGCGNKPSPEPTTYHVRCSQDATKYTVMGLESTYAVGANVSFSVTEVNPEDYKVTGVTSDDVTVTTVSALNYKFTMPEKDVTLTVTTKAVEKYSVTLSDNDVAVGDEVEFTLKLGATQKMVRISAHEGETKEATYVDDKVTFLAEGTYHLDVFDVDSNKMAISDYQVAVRKIEHGETIDDPLTPAEALDIAHGLDITYTEGGVWTNNPSKLEYYIQGRVDLDPMPVIETSKYHNASFTMEGAFEVFQTQSTTKDLYAKIEPGSLVTVKTHIMNFGKKTTPKAEGTAETFKDKDNKIFPNIEVVVNDAAKYVKFDSKMVSVSVDDAATHTANVHAAVYPTVLEKTATYESLDPSIATVTSEGLVTAVSVGTTKIKASYEGCPDAFIDVSSVSGPAVDVWDTEFEVTPVADIVLPDSGDTADKYYIIGEIKEITSTQYGNGTIVDKAGTECAIYGMYDYKGEKRYDSMDAEMKPAVGDVVVLLGKFTKYNGKPEIKNAWLQQKNGTVYSDPVATDFELSQTSLNLYEGGAPVTLTAVGKPDGSVIKGAISWSSNNEAVVKVSDAGVVTIMGKGTATITCTVTDLGSKTCAVSVTEAPTNLKTDLINADFTGVPKPEGTAYAKYTDWSGKVATQSGTTYAGNSATAQAAQNYSLQLRWDTKDTAKRAGIWNTASVGKVKTISIDFDENTADSREILVFGLASACSGTADTNITTDASALGSITKTSTSLTITGDYSYFALRSKTGAIYITSISVTWLVA